MTEAPPVEYQKYSDDPSSFDLRLIGSKRDRAFPAELGVDFAIRKLMEIPKPSKVNSARQYDGYYKKQALQFIKAQLKLRVGVDHLPDDLPRLVRLQAQDLLARKPAADFAMFSTSDRERSVAKKDEQDDITKRLIKAI
ncbi:hypothetical protein PC116_g33920, partial [Phytophthora cactorum]